MNRRSPPATYEPLHVTRFGQQHNIRSVLAGTPATGKWPGYLTKYLTKSLADPLDQDTDETEVSRPRGGR